MDSCESEAASPAAGENDAALDGGGATDKAAKQQVEVGAAERADLGCDAPGAT